MPTPVSVRMTDRLGRILAAVQAWYYIVTGLWPLVSMPTFVAITGPKTDYWLVHMVGLLAAAIGIALLPAARRPASEEARRLGLFAALAFLAIDVFYVANGTLRWTYLLDAGPEAVFALGWLRYRGRPERPGSGA